MAHWCKPPVIVGANWTLSPWRHNHVGSVTACQARHNSGNVGGVTAGQVRHNSGNVGGVTAGQVRHNSSLANNDVTADSASSLGRDIVKHHRIFSAGEN